MFPYQGGIDMDLFYIVLCGILGTSAMSFVMWFITKEGIANADMIRAIGSVITDDNSAFSTGLIIHYIVGIIVAFVYLLFISLFQPQSLWAYTGIGAMIGLFHGVAFAFLLVVVIAEHHPKESYRNAGLEVALAHLGGHVVYGLVVGLVAGIFAVRIIF